MSSKSQGEENTQSDSTFLVFSSLQTHVARFMLWLNIPGCYLILLAVLTGRLETWKSTLPPSQQHAISYFLGFFGAWLFVSHFFGIAGAWLWELWWNPYARRPSLNGRIDQAASQRLAEENRLLARAVLRAFFG